MVRKKTVNDRAGRKKWPIETYEHQRIAVKILDDRGIESLKVLEVPG